MIDATRLMDSGLAGQVLRQRHQLTLHRATQAAQCRGQRCTGRHAAASLFCLASLQKHRCSLSVTSCETYCDDEENGHNNECRAIEVIGQDWSGEVVSLFFEDWELGRVALSCHMAVDLFCQEMRDACWVSLEWLVPIFRILQSRMGTDFEHFVLSLE